MRNGAERSQLGSDSPLELLRTRAHRFRQVPQVPLSSAIMLRRDVNLKISESGQPMRNRAAMQQLGLGSHRAHLRTRVHRFRQVSRVSAKVTSAIANNDLRKCRLSDFSTLGSSDLGSNVNLNSSLTFCFSYITLVEARPVQGATIINYCTDIIYRY